MAEATGQHERLPQREPRRPVGVDQVLPQAGLPANPILVQQQTMGNQAVQRMLRSGVLPAPVILGQQQTLGNRAVQRLLAEAAGADGGTSRPGWSRLGRCSNRSTAPL